MIRQQALQKIADSLLAGIARDPEAPHYRDATFAKKLDHSNRMAQTRLHPPPNEAGYRELLIAEWIDVLQIAQLTAHQEQVFLLRASGWTFESIGRKRGHSKQGAQNIFLQALKKISRARSVYRYTGLADVYRQEVSRAISLGAKR